MFHYKKVLFLLSFTLLGNASTLKEIVQSTLENNYNIQASITENQAKQKTFSSLKNIYNPTATIGMNYTKLDLDKREVQVGSTTNGFFKIGINLYDGGKNQAIKNQKNYEYKASLLNTSTTKKEIALEVVTLFFQTKSVIDSINVFQEKGEMLKAEHERIKIKYDIKMATIDEVLKFESEYESNKFTIEELKYQKVSLLQNLGLLSNLHIIYLDDSKLPKVPNMEFKESENIEAFKMGIQALGENIKSEASINIPQLKLENTLGIYNYNDYNKKLLYDLPDQQNQLMLSLSYNLYDTVSKEKIEALKLEKLASQQKMNFLKNQEKMNFRLAKRKLITQKLQINSLKSAVEMGQTVYEMVTIKYQNGIVDNIAYLDSLSKKTYNEALYQEALNNYEIAKANYYFTSGVDYKDILKKW